MSKQILFKKEARKKLIQGINTLANAVKSTLGPMGRNVIIERPFQAPHVTKDGVTVAKEVSLEDPVENMGADLVRQAASTTADLAGDGTTTSTILAQAMISTAVNLLDTGVNPVILKRGMNKALSDTVHYISQEAETINLESNRLEQVATISANNDPELGQIIAEAVRSVGEDGVVLVDESKTPDTHVDHIKGISFKRGYMSEYFVTRPEKMLVELDKPLILFVDQNIRSVESLKTVVEACNTNGVSVPLLIVADDIIEQALNTIITNKMKAGLQIACVKAPSFGDNRKDLMRDMAIATGGTYISSTSGLDLETLCSLSQSEILSHLGDCDKVTISKNSTTIVGGKGTEEEIEIRVNQIKADLENASNAQYEAQMKDRVAKLSGGVAVLYVGAATEVEMKEKKDRVDDAVHATQAALEEGIVPGGGYLLSLISSALEGLCEECLPGAEKQGYSLVIDSLKAPFSQILFSAGFNGQTFDDAIKENWTEDGVGYNALTDKWENLKEQGIVDPAKVTRVAVENAVSVASTILTTNVTINMKPEDKPQDLGTFGPM